MSEFTPEQIKEALEEVDAIAKARQQQQSFVGCLYAIGILLFLIDFIFINCAVCYLLYDKFSA